jgi:hypothetical protein
MSYGITGYLVEGLELLIRKVAYTKYDATGLVRWSNYILRIMLRWRPLYILSTGEILW